MKAIRLAHVAVAADQGQDLLKVLRQLGLEAVEPEAVPGGGVAVQMVAIGPDRLELLTATGPDTAVGRFVAARGVGLHHLAIEVDDLRAALGQLRASGVRLVDEEPRIGAGGRRIAFLHPASCGGVLIELCEREERTTLG